MKSSLLSEHLENAMRLQNLANPMGLSISEIAVDLNAVFDYLNKHGFHHVVLAGQRYKRTVEAMRTKYEQNPQAYQAGISKNEISALINRISPIFDLLIGHSREIEIVVLNNSAVSDRLRNLHDKLELNASQTILRDEVVRCITCGALRSAMVMAWNLAFDYVRTWIHKDSTRLTDFNNVLVMKLRKKGENYEAIVDFNDFFALKESDVIQWVCEARLINDKVRRALVEWLDRRNDYAHPNDKEPEAVEVMGKISELLAIILDAPFK